MWRKVFALLFGFLILGMTFSTASVAASVVEPIKAQPSGATGIPLGVNPGIKPGDEVRPQFAGIPILLAVGYLVYTFTVHDDVVKWLEEHFGETVAKTYDLAVFAVGFVIPSGEIRWEAEVVKDGGKFAKLIVKAKDAAGRILKKVSFSKEAIEGLAGAGLLKETAENRQIWVNLVKYSERFGLSTDKTAKIVAKISKKGVKKGYIRAMLWRGTNPRALEKLANEYLPHWEGSVSGIHQVVDVFEAKGVVCKVGKVEEQAYKIPNFAVLKQGYHTFRDGKEFGFGLIHILERHASQFDDVFYTQSADDIINLIRETLGSPDFVRYGFDPEKEKWEYRAVKKFGEGKYVFVALDKSGSVTTAYPITDEDKYRKVWEFGEWVYGHLKP